MRWIFAIVLFAAVAVGLIFWFLKKKRKKMEHIVYIHKQRQNTTQFGDDFRLSI